MKNPISKNVKIRTKQKKSISYPGYDKIRFMLLPILTYSQHLIHILISIPQQYAYTFDLLYNCSIMFYHALVLLHTLG